MRNTLFYLLFICFLSGCNNEKALISNPERLIDIEKMLKVQKEITSRALKPIWTVLDNPASKDEEQALKFLFAYMPLSDLADYAPAFMLANVRQSLIARKEMPWGQRIPEEEFLHFVLPVRVNNENLDSFRLVYYAELKARVKGLSMKEAALEINHWCHEKVNYRGTDSRTSAPMSTIQKTFGRCGEESTFTVASMRTAGIPARQVYTPRWAHTDDNHAWVEVWIDGSWHFMGACEPDTDLDRGWFSEPSQRTMLVHTRTYGRYFGPEELLDAEDRFSELNLTSHYARTKKVAVLVKNVDGTAVSGAKIEFKLYNYAEFYPLTTATTDKDGVANFTTGLGDLLVWASKEGKFAGRKLNVATSDTLILVLGKDKPGQPIETMDLVPPSATKPIIAVSDSAKKVNDHRLATEDSIRNSYLATFKDSAWIRAYAEKQQLPTDTLMKVLRLSYGNWQEILTYLKNNQVSARHLLFPLIYGISDKDLSDTKASILTDHLSGALAVGRLPEISADLFNEYVLSARIDLENLVPWRNFLFKEMSSKMTIVQKDISPLISWIQTNIQVDAVANKHSRAPLTPVGVYNLRVADPLSRDIFFVAVCRTFGIPARLNPETRTPEYYKAGIWYRAALENRKVQPEMGKLSLKNVNNTLTPQYYLHFTIAQIIGGISKTVEFEEGRKLTDFPDPLLLETGEYILVTGKRQSEGSVLSSLEKFEIKTNETTSLDVTLRKEQVSANPIGKFDPSSIHLAKSGNNSTITLSDLMKNNGAVILMLDPQSEPSKHVLNDLTPYLSQFNGWNGQFIFVSTSKKEFNMSAFQNYKLPARTHFTKDSQNELGAVLSTIIGKESENNLPLVAFSLSSGEILMLTSGYKIGVGEALLQQIKRGEAKASSLPNKSCTTP